MTLAQRLIDANFASADGVLAIGGLPVTELAAAYGTPLYVYDAAVFERSYRELATAVGPFAEVYYSIKANPNLHIARLFHELGAGLEIASAAEFLIARAAGCPPDRILFAGPGKGVRELALAIENGIGEIHLESFEEIGLCAEIGRRLGVTVPVAIRVNPLAEVQGGAMRMGGRPAAFGFDEEILDHVIAAVTAQPSLHLSGVHLFAGTQILDAAVLIAQWRHGLSLARRVAQTTGRPLRTLDLGGGLGIPYHANDQPLDLPALAIAAPELAAERPEGLRVLIEPGRYLAGPAGVYLSTVRAVKQSRGSRFIVTDGGMHHHLAASGNLGQVIKRDYPIVAATRLDDAVEPATLCGPLCTPLDTLGRQTPLPHVKAGDLIAILQSGAYGLTASPNGFLSHPAPAEVLVRDGQATLIREPGTFAAAARVTLETPHSCSGPKSTSP